MLLATLLLACLPERAHGLVALMAEPFELSAPLASQLAPSGQHAILHVGALPGRDPLLNSSTAFETLRLDPSAWNAESQSKAVELVNRSQAIVLCGGTWTEWWVLTREVTHRNHLAEALQHALRSGRSLVGIGSAAEYIGGQALLLRSEIRRPRRNPRAPEVLLAAGLNLAPELALCTQPSRIDDFMEAVQRNGHSRALCMQGSIACVIDPATQALRWEGSGRALQLDFSGSRRARAVPVSTGQGRDSSTGAEKASGWWALLQVPSTGTQASRVVIPGIEARWSEPACAWELTFGPQAR